jgi:hypothetical protein
VSFDYANLLLPKIRVISGIVDNGDALMRYVPQ